MMETVVSGIRSTGKLHLGNYYGAIRNFIRMQNENRCYFFIADYHALTTHPKPDDLHGNIRQVLSEFLACGIDPDKATLFIQSDVPEVSELYLLLNMNTYVGELERTTSFKEKIRKHPDNINAGLLTYPVLMAADIIIHKATKVPVGKDQEQHLEMTRRFARRSTLFTEWNISRNPMHTISEWSSSRYPASTEAERWVKAKVTDLSFRHSAGHQKEDNERRDRYRTN